MTCSLGFQVSVLAASPQSSTPPDSVPNTSCSSGPNATAEAPPPPRSTARRLGSSSMSHSCRWSAVITASNVRPFTPANASPMIGVPVAVQLVPGLRSSSSERQRVSRPEPSPRTTTCRSVLTASSASAPPSQRVGTATEVASSSAVVASVVSARSAATTAICDCRLRSCSRNPDAASASCRDCASLRAVSAATW